MIAFSNKQHVEGHSTPGEGHSDRALTAWLGEANWDLDDEHTLFARIENVANGEL